MIEYISTFAELSLEKKTFGQVFNDQISLPSNLFVNTFSRFKAFEFDLIYDPAFYEGLQSFMRNIDGKGFTFYTISPSPEEYFFRHFSKYSVGKVSITCSYKDYMDFLSKDPGNSPADALRYNSATVMLYSNNPNWGIIGDKDWEIAMVGFKDMQTQELFLNSFNENIFFGTVNERMRDIDLMVNLTALGKQFYSDLERNYNQL